MGMRPPVRLLFCAAIAVFIALPAAAAQRAPRPVEGTLAVRDGKGVFQLAVRGSVVGSVEDAERVIVYDPNPSDFRRATVRGWDERRRINRRKVIFEGEDLRIRAARGFFRLTIVGTGVQLSVVGMGPVTMAGDESYADTGVYSLNGGAFEPVPYERETVQVGAPAGG
jgi:hypothetical protein